MSNDKVAATFHGRRRRGAGARSLLTALVWYGGQIVGDWLERGYGRRTRAYNRTHHAPGERRGSSWVARGKDQT